MKTVEEMARDGWMLGIDMSLEDIRMAEPEEVAAAIRACDSWMDCWALLPRLCEMAGLSEEWAAANGEEFESVLAKAGARLGVDII